MPIYRKQRGSRFYWYEQTSYREGRKVRTRSRYLGPVEGYQIEPGETAAFDGIVSDFEKGPRPEAPQWSQNEFLAETQSTGDEPQAGNEGRDALTDNSSPT